MRVLASVEGFKVIVPDVGININLDKFTYSGEYTGDEALKLFGALMSVYRNPNLEVLDDSPEIFQSNFQEKLPRD